MVKAWCVASMLGVGAVVQAMPVDPMLIGEVEFAVAQGRHADAVERLSSALDALSGDAHAAVRADLWRALAEVHESAGDWADAAIAWVHAAEAMAATLGSSHPDIAAVYDRASQAYERAGDEAAALAAGEQAFAIDAQHLSGDDLVLAQSRERLYRLALDFGDQRTAMRYRPVRQRGRGTGAMAVPQTPAGEVVDRITADYGGADEERFTRVRVFFGTDRASSGSRRINDYFGSGRGALTFGSVEVSVPASHKPGAIEAPSLTSFEIRENPERHMVLLELETYEGDEALRRMRETLAERGSDEAFVFVHGYNVSFANAARRTAQISYDINFEGLPIMYSWPSRASTLNYIADTAVVRHSGRHLYRFLDAVVRESGARRIHLVGHSMGNRALTDALEIFALRHADRESPAFEQVIFTAPDVDSGLFGEMLQTIRPTARRLTLYASQFDRALIASQRLHGSQPRAGQAGRDVLVHELVDTVDMSPLGEDMLGHSYFANDVSALTDLLALFWGDQPPEQRCGLVAHDSAGQRHWRFDPEACDGQVMLSAISLLRAHGPAAVDYARRMLTTSRDRNIPRAIDEWTRIDQHLARLLSGRTDVTD